MPPSYFDTPEKLSILRRMVASLIGTPFFANSEAPGKDGGMDCVHTLNWLYRSCGVLGLIQIPRQAMDAGAHTDRSLLIEAFETWPAVRSRFACVWKRDAAETQNPKPETPNFLLPGDALCFIAGKVPHHGGVLLEGGDFLHTLRADGVHTMRLDAVVRGLRILGQLAAVYRPLPL